MTLADIMYGIPSNEPEEVINDIKKYFISLLEPYIGPDFRTAERVIRDAD